VADSESGRDAVQASADETEAVSYPTYHVVGILDTADQTSCALDALLSRGFLESEVDVNRGPDDADRLAAGSGRRGLQDWFIRLTGSVGLKNAETEMKERYERAMRDQLTVIAVLAPTDERKALASEILQGCGAHFVNFFGRFNVERMH
jgi:hypothetical protein